jgi:TPR repeat protein
MTRKTADESVQVRQVLNNCKDDGSVDERLLIAIRAMYGYGGRQQNLQEGFELFQALAKEDKSGVAYGYLASYYQHGWVTPPDLDKAIELYKEGAALGSASCLSSLGLMLHKGEERHQNLPEAIRLFRAAADLGCPHGINNAAVFYLEQDYQNTEGLALIKKAADLGEQDACFSVFLLSRERRPHEAARYLLKCRELVQNGSGLDEQADSEIALLARKNPDALVPYGYWEPRWKVHKWVSPTIWREMRIMLMMRKRPDSLWHLLPRDLALEICFWLCTLPRPERAFRK